MLNVSLVSFSVLTDNKTEPKKRPSTLLFVREKRSFELLSEIFCNTTSFICLTFEQNLNMKCCTVCLWFSLILKKCSVCKDRLQTHLVSICCGSYCGSCDTIVSLMHAMLLFFSL